MDIYFFCIFVAEMKRAANIFFSFIMLTMILLGTAGVSLEKCSCTGKISLALPMDNTCCPGEGNCMTVKSMQLSDYMPTVVASLDVPVLPVLFSLFSPQTLTAETVSLHLLESHSAQAPPGALAHTVDVLRV